jgi:RES domain
MKSPRERPRHAASAPSLHPALPLPALVSHTIDSVRVSSEKEADPRAPKVWDPGRWRFDAPAAEYPVTYTGATFEVCVAEKFQDTRLIEAGHASQRVWQVTSSRPLRLIPVDQSLVQAQLGTDARIWTEVHYRVTQQWGLALHSWYPDADGIRYTPRHTQEQTSFALYLDRCASTLSCTELRRLGDDRHALLRVAVPRRIVVDF